MCVAHLLHTDHLAVSLLSQHRTRHVWTRSTCHSWPNWERLQSPPLEDIPSPRAGRLGHLELTVANHQWSAAKIVASLPCEVKSGRKSECICYVQHNRPPWMNSGPAENRSFHSMPGGPHSFPPPMPSMGGPPMPPNPNGMPPPWMQPPPPPMGQNPGPHGHPMGKSW